jgi:hypothetical protein
MGNVVVLVEATIDGSMAGPDRELDPMVPDPVMSQGFTTHWVARGTPSSPAATPTTPQTEHGSHRPAAGASDTANRRSLSVLANLGQPTRTHRREGESTARWRDRSSYAIELEPLWDEKAHSPLRSRRSGRIRGRAFPRQLQASYRL